MQFITLTDYLLLPFYLAIIYLVAYNFRNKKYPEGHPWRKYFIPGLTVKIVGALFIGIIYQYYYGGGDTANYFLQAKAVNSSFSESPTKWFNLLLHIPNWWNPEYYTYTSQMEWYGQLNTYIVISLCAFFSAFCFNTFLPCSIVFAALCYTGVWAMFRTFARQYPHLQKQIAIAVLFVPSTFIWGSGIFKDTVCMFGLGWMTYGVFQLLIQRKFSVFNIIITVISFLLIGNVKIYILLAFLPAIALWILFSYSHKIKTPFIRFFIKLSVTGLAGFAFFIAAQKFSNELGQYSLDNVAKTSTVTRDWILYSSGDAGSGYDLGEIDPTIGGMLKKFPKAVNVTLFRPYLWEAKKPIVFMNAVEACLFLLITLKIIFVIGPVKIWKAINEDPNIQFCLIFVIIFAFSVGISSFNFGTLSRYRIPCLPLYALALMLIYYKYKDPETSIFSLQ